MAYIAHTNVLPSYNYGYDDLERRVDRLVSGQFAQEVRYNNNSYQNDYALTAFYQSLCNSGYSGNYNSTTSSSINRDTSWCSNGIF
jgi:hypothetical protein